ncbi:MAG: hypothetical protein IT384_04455 [Deltaproteobacteria bacterium]|nr:hypothetical protein [Deltaproteobacteria bacterium]
MLLSRVSFALALTGILAGAIGCGDDIPSKEDTGAGPAKDSGVINPDATTGTDAQPAADAVPNPDAQTADTGAEDAGIAADGSAAADAAEVDGQAGDASDLDGATQDAAVDDGSIADATGPDATPIDGGGTDGGGIDGGGTDGGVSTGACAAPRILRLGTNNGDTARTGSVHQGSCLGANTAEEVWQFDAPSTGILNLTLTSTADLGVYVRGTCTASTSETRCVDGFYGGAAERTDLPVAQGQRIFVIVDGVNEVAPYVLDAQLAPSACDNALTGHIGANAGTTVGGRSSATGSCAGRGQAEQVVGFTPADDGVVVLTLTSTADLALYARTDCANSATELGCENRVGGGSDEAIGVRVFNNEHLSIFVDGATGNTAQSASYSLQIDFAASPCGAAQEAILGDQLGDTTASGNGDWGSCVGPMFDEEAWRFVPTVTGTLRIEMLSVADLGLYVRTTCLDPVSEIGCVDRVLGDAVETLDVPVTVGTPVFIIVDGYEAGAPYLLSLSML